MFVRIVRDVPTFEPLKRANKGAERIERGERPERLERSDMFKDFQTRCETIEEAYEFMLAYAAQGLQGDGGTQTGGQLREFLTRAATALTGLGALFESLIEKGGLEPAGSYRAYGAVLDRDARDSLAAVELVLTQPSISSQLIDNLNASIHLRALLTDLFLIDELLKSVTSTPVVSGT